MLRLRLSMTTEIGQFEEINRRGNRREPGDKTKGDSTCTGNLDDEIF